MKMPLLKKLQIENKLLKEDLNSITPSVSGSGEDITLNNTANARFKKFRVSGNDYQKVTEQSKNFLNVPEEYIIDKTIKNVKINLKPGNYTIKANFIETDNDTSTFLFLFKYKEGGDEYIYLRKSSLKTNFDLTKETLLVNIYSGQDYDFASKTVATFKQLMLYEGSEDIPYEPFIPNSPSPEYPSEIRNCGDNANLIDYPFLRRTKRKLYQRWIRFYQ